MTTLDTSVSAMRSAASGMDQCGSQVAEVGRTALMATALDGGAFGILCSFLVPTVLGQQVASLGMITALAGAINGEAAALRAAASAYELADSALDRVKELDA